jgi:4-hydroxy-tetrahydrodipicolinate synthase
MFGTLAEGGAGAIAASAHLATPSFVRLVALLRAGELAPARSVWPALVPLIEGVFAEPNPGPLKAVLADLGEMKNELRAPMTSASDALRERLRALIRP